MKLNILIIYKPAIFSVILLLLKSMLMSAQSPVQQFWQLNSPSILTWDNTSLNKQVDNGSGTFTTTSLTWTSNKGATNSKIQPYKDIVFGGNPGVAAAGTVTLSTPLDNVKSISFHPAASGNFTITGGSITSYASNTNLNVSVDSGLSPTIFSPFTGTYSFTKKGLGTLILTHNNTFVGNTAVTEGILQIGAGTTGTISSSNMNVSPGATLMWNNGANNLTLNNNLSGTGTVRFQGSNSSSSRTGSYLVRGNNSGFSGNMKVNGTCLWLTSLQSQLGSAVISVEQAGTLLLQTNVFNNVITLEDKCGWYNGNATANVLGGIWLNSSASLSGSLVLNNTTLPPSDASGLYSALGVWDGGNSTISGVISGPGHLSMSNNTGGFTGSLTICNISLTGTLSNIYSGLTIVDGRQGVGSLLLRKTGGAVAIPSNGTVWMGNNSVGSANLRMGDDVNTGNTTGATRNQWNNQFGANVLMQFNNTAANLMRFDLQGTNQTLAGLNCGNTSTAGGGAVQNQGANGFNPVNPATLTLNGSGNYVYNGIMRDQEIGTTNKLNLVWNGTGSQTLVGASIIYTGTTNIISGKLVCYDTSAYNSNTTINSGGFFEIHVSSLTTTGAYTISGAGSLVKTGLGTQTLSGNNTYSGGTTINEGTLTAGQINAFGTGIITVKAGATLNKNGFAITNTVTVEPGGIVLP